MKKPIHVGRVHSYQIKCSLLLAGVPMLCFSMLTALLYCFASLNLYFLENAGMLVNEEIRQAYHDQVQMELFGVGWYVVVLYIFAFGLSYFIMGWAVSPFVNAERTLLASLEENTSPPKERLWMSESPLFRQVIVGLVRRLKDEKFPFDNFEEPSFKFSYRFFVKFVIAFYSVSIATGYIMGILLNVAYDKIVSMAIMLVRLNHRGHFFLAQEELLRNGVTFMMVLSCIIYAVIGFYVTRYLSNMIFVFTRAIKLHHFPLKLRHSDVYHGLADAISKVADKAGLVKKNVR